MQYKKTNSFIGLNFKNIRYLRDYKVFVQNPISKSKLFYAAELFGLFFLPAFFGL